MDFLNYQIICGPEVSKEPIKVFGTDSDDGNLILRSSNNSQTIYIDGAGDGDWPVYLGITKSRGTQSNKLPLENNDIVGGLQAYARIKSGSNLGYSDEVNLIGSIIYRLDEKDSSELMIATAHDSKLKIKLILDSQGNLKTSGTIKTGRLEITDQIVKPQGEAIKFIKVVFDGIEYAMPLYSIQ